jgi:hypothetical protein
MVGYYKDRMVSCRYVGSDTSNVGEREFSLPGEVAVFSEATFADAVLGGCPLIPEVAWKKLAITTEETSAYAENPEEVSPNFLLKLDIAKSFYRDLRSRLGQGQPIYKVVSEATSVDLAESIP